MGKKLINMMHNKTIQEGITVKVTAVLQIKAFVKVLLKVKLNMKSVQANLRVMYLKVPEKCSTKSKTLSMKSSKILLQSIKIQLLTMI
jgi:hypothetical protein